jgi:hypothetical protein
MVSNQARKRTMAEVCRMYPLGKLLGGTTDCIGERKD